MTADGLGWGLWRRTSFAMPLDVSPLNSLNANPSLDLTYAVNLTLGDEDEVNPYIEHKLTVVLIILMNFLLSMTSHELMKM
jgi:hypothetical protein